MIYVLQIILTKDIRIVIGRLGKLNFAKGTYFYIGSAKKNHKARLSRHLSKKKKLFWHIDYLLKKTSVKIYDIWTRTVDGECITAAFLGKEGYSYVNKFGSSDCKCPSHLFFIGKKVNRLNKIIKKQGFKNASKDYL